MMRVAVIGGGISGLAAAYYLSRKHRVFVLEAESRLGGHTHTVPVETSRGPMPIDTGFIVDNERRIRGWSSCSGNWAWRRRRRTCRSR